MFKRLFIILAALVISTSVYAAEVKISALPEVASVLATDVLPLNASGVTSKIQMVNLGVPGSVGASGAVPRGGGAGVIPGWSTFTIADTFAKGTFVYANTANTLEALAHPGAANYLLATNAADSVGWFASSADVITLLGSANAAAIRTNAGLAIGTNVQAASVILLGIAATTPAAGLLGYTGAAYDWYTGISLSNNSLRHFYDDTAGYYSNSDCTANLVPAACCTGVGTGTCAPKYVGIDPVGMTGTKSAKLAFQNTADAIYTFPVATGSLANIASSISDSDLTHCPDGNSVFDALALKAPLASPTFTGPVLGIATGTSLIVTGRLDGLVGMVTSTANAATTIASASNASSYYMNIGDSDAHSIYTLPTAAAGLQYCVKNYTGISRVVTFQTSAAGQYIDLDGTLTATGGFIKSAGAAGDAACVVGVDATHWVAYVQKGVWSRD